MRKEGDLKNGSLIRSRLALAFRWHFEIFLNN